MSVSETNVIRDSLTSRRLKTERDPQSLTYRVLLYTLREDEDGKGPPQNLTQLSIILYAMRG